MAAHNASGEGIPDWPWLHNPPELRVFPQQAFLDSRRPVTTELIIGRDNNAAPAELAVPAVYAAQILECVPAAHRQQVCLSVMILHAGENPRSEVLFNGFLEGRGHQLDSAIEQAVASVLQQLESSSPYQVIFWCSDARAVLDLREISQFRAQLHWTDLTCEPMIDDDFDALRGAVNPACQQLPSFEELHPSMSHRWEQSTMSLNEALQDMQMYIGSDCWALAQQTSPANGFRVLWNAFLAQYEAGGDASGAIASAQCDCEQNVRDAWIHQSTLDPGNIVRVYGQLWWIEYARGDGDVVNVRTARHY